jgi:subtilisin family serine protease
MRRLFLLAFAAGMLPAVPAAAQRSPFDYIAAARPGAVSGARVQSRAPRGLLSPFWLDEDTCVIPRVERCATAATAEAEPQEAIIRLRPGVSVAAFAVRHGLSIQRALATPGAYTVRAHPSRRLTRSLAALSADPALQYAEPNRRVRITALPNDPRFSEQWGFSLAQMPTAWDLQKGTIDTYNPDPGVVVGVMDTGISPTHPDLRSRIAPGGRNFINGSSNAADDNGHGTHIAGLIAASTHNAVGVSGGTWEGVRVLSLKVFDASGNADISVLADGLRYAADLGLKVVNLSAGTPDDSPTTRDAVTYFLNRPHHPILVTASGNDSDRSAVPAIVNPPLIPARYADARIIGVSGVGRQGEVAWYSNAGAGVDIAAPGGNSNFDGDSQNIVLSTTWSPSRGDSYAFLEGTSMATPHVSAAIALLLSEGVRTDDVENVLYRSVTGYNGTRNNNLGYGVLNTSAALNSVAASTALDWPSTRYPVETTSTSILGRLLNARTTGVSVSVDGQAAIASVQSTGSSTRVTARTALGAGAHTVAVTAAGALTARPRTTTLSFTVRPKVLLAGWHMFSLPYSPSPAAPPPSSVFSGRPFKLARWVPSLQQYAVIDAETTRNDTSASFAPTDPSVASTPVGIGYWVYLAQDTPLTLTADPVVNAPYRVPLVEGWNQVGGPYVFPVRLADGQFQTASGTVSVAEALSKGWLRPSAFRLAPTGDKYDKQPAGDVLLRPWESVWLRSIVAGTLILPAKPAP